MWARPLVFEPLFFFESCNAAPFRSARLCTAVHRWPCRLHRCAPLAVHLHRCAPLANNRWHQTRGIYCRTSCHHTCAISQSKTLNNSKQQTTRLIKPKPTLMGRSPSRRPTLYLNSDGTPPEPPQGGWLPCSKNSQHGRELVRLFQIGAIPFVSRIHLYSLCVLFIRGSMFFRITQLHRSGTHSLSFEL